jgi:GxxExxY protein
MEHEEVTGKILECCFEVAKELGSGFLESVYEKALMVALSQKGLQVAAQVPIKVTFRGVIVGDFFADLVVAEAVLVEIKAVSQTLPVHKAQVINYLNATGMNVGLLVNFGTPRIEYFRLRRPDHSPDPVHPAHPA